MAYYDALVTKWGTLSGTTASKLSQINALTVTGSVPTTFFVTGAQLINSINWAEFNSLTSQQQSNILALCSNQGQLLGGSSNTSLLTDGMIIAYFPPAGITIANLTALAKGSSTPWWQASVANGGGGLNGSVTSTDLVAAGNLV